MKFYHYKAKVNKGGVTLAYEIVDNKEAGRCLRIAFAVCSKKDQYCKKTGRTIAESRLVHNERVLSLPIKHKPRESDLFYLAHNLYNISGF